MKEPSNSNSNISHLKLIKSEDHRRLWKFFPRFPLADLVFKSEGGGNGSSEPLLFRVNHISDKQIHLQRTEELKEKPPYRVGDTVGGKISDHGKLLEVEGKVSWVGEGECLLRLPEKGNGNGNGTSKVTTYLNALREQPHFRLINQDIFETEIHHSLGLWIKNLVNDEIFTWCHPNGDLLSFDIFYKNGYLQWVDGQGLSVGYPLFRKCADTPMTAQNHVLIDLHPELPAQKLKAFAQWIEFIQTHLDQSLERQKLMAQREQVQNALNLMAQKLARG